MVLNKAFGERFKVRFESRGALPERKVLADRKRVLQVMTNLLSNAAKFSPRAGWWRSRHRRPGANVRLAVHDRGTGIPEGFRGRIFGRFTQADAPPPARRAAAAWASPICKRLVE